MTASPSRAGEGTAGESRGPEGAEEGEAVVLVGSVRRGERSATLEFGGEEFGSLGGGRSCIVDADAREHGTERFVVALGVLADVEGGEVEADHGEYPAHTGEASVGE